MRSGGTSGVKAGLIAETLLSLMALICTQAGSLARIGMADASGDIRWNLTRPARVEDGFAWPANLPAVSGAPGALRCGRWSRRPDYSVFVRPGQSRQPLSPVPLSAGPFPPPC